jgi:hypothetical protein
MGISYQTRNRLRRKVHTAPLTPLPEVQHEAAAPEAVVPARRTLWWPMVAAVAVAATAFSFLYRG